MRFFVILIVFHFWWLPISLSLFFYPHNYFSKTNEYTYIALLIHHHTGGIIAEPVSSERGSRISLRLREDAHAMHLAHDTRRRISRQATIPNRTSSSFVSNLAKEKCEHYYVTEKWEKTENDKKKNKRREKWVAKNRDETREEKDEV